MGARLRRLLFALFGLFGVLAVNGAYLGAVTALEWFTGAIYQGYFYQVMFLAHLFLGLLMILPALTFGAAHMRNAWSRPNRAAVRAGLGLYSSVVLLVASGIVLTRFDFFAVKHPDVRAAAYWIHVVVPVAMAWLFVLHRLAGRPIRWQVGVRWLAAAVVLTLGLLLWQAPDPGEATVSDATYAGDNFLPSLARTGDGKLIPARALMMDDYCRECHADVHEQWSHSAHRLSSFNNPAYRFSVRETRKVAAERGDTRAARFCAGCHDPVPLFAGAFDDPDFDDEGHPTAAAGITCTSCHAIASINSPRGNADFTIEAPLHYPFAYSDNAFLQWVNRQLVKAKPEFHKKTFLKPLHREPEFCGVCHKVHLPEELNRYKWLRGQNHFDAFALSGVSGGGASSFYYPAQAVRKCALCHMPLVASADFAAGLFDNSGELKVHDHQFLGANTALPHLVGFPAWVNEKHRAYLQGALRVDIFSLKEDGLITGAQFAPLRPELPVLEPGRRYLLETVIRTLRLGHTFTQGTSDSNEVWLDVTVTSGDRLIGRSGGMDANGAVDPWSHFVNSYVLDREGNRIDRRNAQDIFTALYNHQIPPGAADVVHYAFQVPGDLTEPVAVEVKLLYRKFDTTYLRHFQGDSFRGNDLPVVTLASDRVVLPVAGGTAVSGTEPGIAGWERWNDYGIGLLRKGDRGELRQAEHAFRRVEALGRPDGPLNLARIYLREGRLEEAVGALQRAAAHDPPADPWVVAWISGQVNKQNGYLDQAIADFQRVIATDFEQAHRRGFDFSRDYRVINELGQALFERAKQERGVARRGSRDAYLAEAARWFQRVLELDPENVTAHYNLALLYELQDEPQRAQEHRVLHARYRPDDNAGDRAVSLHRRRNPAADHAAAAVVIYDLQRPGAYGLPLSHPGALAMGPTSGRDDSHAREPGAE